jgi:predicted amidophosphoribosyltransferase
VTYILFDDIWTTGASMKTAIKKLRQAGAIKIIVILLAISRLEN